MLLALASQKERKQQWIIHHVLNIILSDFVPSSIHSSCWMQDAKCRQNIQLSKVCFDIQISLDGIFITYLSIRIIFYLFLLFYHLLINISSFIKPKNLFSTLDQGFPISEKRLEALVWFILSPCAFSSFHRSFPLSKSKNNKKICSDFNLLTFLFVDSTSTCL